MTIYSSEEQTKTQSISIYFAFKMLLVFIFFIFLTSTTTTLNLVHSLPIVDKGVFVITGVKTCGGGGGYCVLGQDCFLDKEFTPDTNEGHCDGLRKAFTPRAFFVCCEYVDLALQTTTTTTTTTQQASTLDPSVNSDESTPENDDSAQSPESKESTSVESSEDDYKNKTTIGVSSTTTKVGIIKPVTNINIIGEEILDDNSVNFDTTTERIQEVTTTKILPNTNYPHKPTTTTTFNLNGLTTTQTGSHNNVLHVPILNQSKHPLKEEEQSQINPASNVSKVTVGSESDNVYTTTTVPPSTPLSSTGHSSHDYSTHLPGVLQDSPVVEITTTSPIPTVTPKGDKEHVTTTVVSYSEKTEISMEQSVSLHVAQKQCGVKLSTSPRLDSPRLATQSSAGTTSTTSCWTGAIVRSPSALSMQADPGAFICAGALIHPSVLLTTATCVSRLFAQDLSLFKVALGSTRLLHPLSGPTPDADYRDIKTLIIHENYHLEGHVRIDDVALVMLSEPADMSRTCTLCLPDEDSDFTGRDCTVSGYSHPSDSSTMESDGYDGILHEADQRVEYQSTCEQVLTNFTQHSFRTEKELHLLCASGKYSAEACFSPRDAGSPLACNQNGINFLVGSFSSGFHCGNANMPVLYTSIKYFVSWINRNLIKSVVVF